MKENNKPYDDRPVPGKELSRCFDELKKSLGRPVVETVIYELEIMHGIVLEGRFSYQLSELEDALKKLLGDSAAELMMESIVKYLSEK